MTRNLIQSIVLSCSVSGLVCVWGCNRVPSSTDCPHETSSVQAHGREVESGVEKELRTDDPSSRIDVERAKAIATQYLIGLRKGDRFPRSVAVVPACSNQCFDIETRSLSEDCSRWDCRFSFGDPENPVSGRVVLVNVGIGDIRIEPAGFEMCLSAAHECEIGLSHEEAMVRLGASIDVDVGIVWSPTRNEFFWENKATGERVRFHP